MGECSKEECCPKKDACHNYEEHEEGNYKWFLEIADEAWAEALKEKIKEHILETQGKRLKELAAIISETNSERWKHKMEKKRKCKDFKEKIAHFFGGK